MLQQRARLAVLQNALDDVIRLAGLVADVDQERAGAGVTVTPQVLGEPLLGEADNAIGGGEDGLGGAVIALQRDDLGRGRELSRIVKNVADIGTTEGIDRLGVIPDHRQAGAIGFHAQQNGRLQPVAVLVLINQYMVEITADLGRQVRVGDHLRPIEQQIIVIEHVLPLLGLDIGTEELLEFRLPAGAPWKARGQDIIERQFGVHAAGIDLQASSLRREALRRLGKPQLMPHQIHQVRGILPVMDGKGGVEPDLHGVVAQQFRADGVKRPGPGHALGQDAGLVAQCLGADALGPPRHLGRGPAREGHKQDTARVGAVDDQMGDTMGERVGLARAGTGNDQQRPSFNTRPHAMLGRAALLGIEFGKVLQARRHVKLPKKCRCPASWFLVLFARVCGRSLPKAAAKRGICPQFPA